MPATFTAGNNAVSVSPLDLIQSAMQEIGVVAAGETLSAEDAAWGLEKLQRLIDTFNAQRELIFSTNFNLFTLTPNHAPHTIGPSGDFNVPIRPVKVISCSFILNSGSQAVDLPVNADRDDAWWAANPLKSLTSSIVTDLYYDSASPLGNLNFYPISNVAAQVRLQTWNSLAQAIDLTTALGFVQGYWEAIVSTLAVSLCPSYERQPSAVLVAMQQKAIQVIAQNNGGPPRIDTTSGLPGSSNTGRPDFNFLTGMRE
jgi:hypothetical protein